ncbi:MAG: radical SAM protein [Polyangiaceae bacterium]|nr:radical SAM protein [Polyangiaceae bacterium]
MIKLLRKYGFYPRVAVWELTLKCDLNCRHCGSKAGRARDDELTLPEARKLARELAELKCKFLTLSGGEPLLRKDWALIAETLVDGGVTTGMISNGRHWTDDIARTFRAIGLESVAFSVDGFQEAHEYQRRVKGQWQQVLNTIDNAVGHGIKTSVVTTVNNRNLHELEDLRELLAAHGVLRWQVQFATATGNMADNKGLVMDPKEILYAVPVIARMCRDDKRPKVYPGHDVGYYGEYEESLRDPKAAIPFWTGCSAGCSVIGIESNGNIKGCLSLPSAMNGVDKFVEGNVRRNTLREIWFREGAFAYNRNFTIDQLGGFCRTCEYNDICRGGCTWSCFAETGELLRDNPYCYYRQLKELEEAGGKVEDIVAGVNRRRLPVVAE